MFGVLFWKAPVGKGLVILLTLWKHLTRRRRTSDRVEVVSVSASECLVECNACFQERSERSIRRSYRVCFPVVCWGNAEDLVTRMIGGRCRRVQCKRTRADVYFTRVLIALCLAGR